MLSQGQLTPKEAYDVLLSYCMADEGTNTLYLRLVDTLLKKQDEFTFLEIEMILNYFPHNIWKNDPALSRVKDSFYFPILKVIKLHLDNFDKQ